MKWINLFRILLIAFSLYLLYILLGFYINGMVNLKYDTVSVSDIEYCIKYSKILIIYTIIVVIYIFCAFKKNKSKNNQ